MPSKLHAQVQRTIEKYRMLGPSDRVLVAVSGGADSVCMALVIQELGYEFAIAHVNHGLRGAASDDDETFTAALAKRLGVRFFARKVLLVGGNIEAAGRQARKDFFAELARQNGFTKIAVAHTQNDRSETLLLNLIRGAGTSGLASMPALSGLTIRPLLESTRDDVEDYLREKKQPWQTDASNFNLDFARNRLRHSVIPQLAREFNPRLVETLGRTAEILEGEDAWMRGCAEQWLLANGTKNADTFVLNVEPLHRQGIAFVRRVLRAALSHPERELRDVSFERIESVRDLLEDGKSGKVVELPGGIRVTREFDQLAFRRTGPTPEEYEYQLPIPGSIHIPESGRTFRAEIVEGEGRQPGAQRVFVDADSIGPYVRIRNWKPGDFYKPVGLPAGKLKKLFQRARIPRSHRKNWPVVVAGATIIWVVSFPVSREFVPRGYSQKIAVIEAIQI